MLQTDYQAKHLAYELTRRCASDSEEKLAAAVTGAQVDQRNDKRCSLFEAQDAIDQQREDLIRKIEGKLNQQAGHVSLFTIRWALK